MLKSKDKDLLIICWSHITFVQMADQTSRVKLILLTADKIEVRSYQANQL